MYYKDNYEMLGKVILNTCSVYAEKSREDGALMPDIIYRLAGQLKVYQRADPFTEEQYNWVMNDGRTDAELGKITKKPVSFVVFILELMKHYIKEVEKRHRPNLNISDKKLIVGKAAFFKHMLIMKQKNKDAYQEKKEIIDDTVEVAEELFNYYKKLFIEGE